LPYQAPPVMVGVAVTGMRLATVLRLTAPLTAICLLVLLPLEYLWWWVLGYFR